MNNLQLTRRQPATRSLNSVVLPKPAGADDDAEDGSQPPRPPLVDIGDRAVEVLVVALLLGELVELEQGEGLFDVESGFDLIRRLPFFSASGLSTPHRLGVPIWARKHLILVGPDQFEFVRDIAPALLARVTR